MVCYSSKKYHKGNSTEDVGIIAEEEDLVLIASNRLVIETKKAYDQEVIKFVYLRCLMQEHRIILIKNWSPTL